MTTCSCSGIRWAIFVMLMLCSQVVFSTPSWGECRQVTQRKEIRELTVPELNNLTQAIRHLQSNRQLLPFLTPQPGYANLSQLEQLAKLHAQNSLRTHYVPQFLPWHRHFLRLMERALQAVNPSVSLVYWDWSLDSQHPHQSPILSDMYFGGNGNPQHNWCLEEGPFRFTNLSYPSPHCLKRNYDRGTALSPFFSTESVLLNLNKRSFSEFAANMEIKHAYPHANIGDQEGDLLPMSSPVDPLFWLHHTYIDRLWYHWQLRHPNIAHQYEGQAYGIPWGVSPDDMLYGMGGYQVLDTLFPATHRFYCYTYNPIYPRLIYPPILATNRSSVIPKPLQQDITNHPLLIKTSNIHPMLNLTIDQYLAKEISNCNGTLTNIQRAITDHSDGESGGDCRLVSPKSLADAPPFQAGVWPRLVNASELHDQLLVNKLNQEPQYVPLPMLQRQLNIMAFTVPPPTLLTQPHTQTAPNLPQL